MTEQQQRLHWVLDYGGHAACALLLAYSGFLVWFGDRSERGFGLTLLVWAIGFWVATRIILYILSGQIPFATRQGQKWVFALVTLLVMAVTPLLYREAEEFYREAKSKQHREEEMQRRSDVLAACRATAEYQNYAQKYDEAYQLAKSKADRTYAEMYAEAKRRYCERDEPRGHFCPPMKRPEFTVTVIDEYGNRLSDPCGKFRFGGRLPPRRFDIDCRAYAFSVECPPG